MNILLVSNSDICRSRMAQKILSSFGHGTKIFTSGVLPGRVVPSSVVGVMEQNGYDCSRKKASDVDIYCHQPWDYVITLCEEAKEVEGDFNKEVKNWRHFSFDDPFQHIYEDETELEHRISELYERHYKIFCVNGNTGFRNESRIFYFIHLQNEEAYERKESSSA